MARKSLPRKAAAWLMRLNMSSDHSRRISSHCISLSRSETATNGSVLVIGLVLRWGRGALVTCPGEARADSLANLVVNPVALAARRRHDLAEPVSLACAKLDAEHRTVVAVKVAARQHGSGSLTGPRLMSTTPRPWHEGQGVRVTMRRSSFSTTSTVYARPSQTWQTTFTAMCGCSPGL